MPRLVAVLRVSDALAAGATQREIARALFGAAAVERDWNDRSDALRSRLRRLVRDARALTAGGYRQLLRASGRSSPRQSSRSASSIGRSSSVKQGVP
jgi:hypothetical protein